MTLTKASFSMITGAPINVLDFGADPTGVADSLPAFNAAIASALDVSDPYRPVAGMIYVPRGTYFLNGTLTISAQVNIVGQGCGNFNLNSITKLRFPANTPGIVFTQLPTTAAASLLQDIAIVSDGNTTYNVNAHGVDLKTLVRLQNVVIDGFGGNGINVNTVGGNANDNLFIFENVWATHNGCHGVYTAGGDSNAGVGIAVNCSYNGRYGICDESFLGNTWIGCHVDANALQLSGNTITFVSHGGNRYACLSSSIDTTTVPGTDASVWELLGAGGVSVTYPAWSAGNNYVAGGAYKATGSTQSNVFVGCYAESGQPPCWFAGTNVVIGGTLACGFIGGKAPLIRSTVSGTLAALTGIQSTSLAYGANPEFYSQLGGTYGDVLALGGVGFDSTGQPTKIRVEGKDVVWDWVYNVSALLTGYETTYTFGRADPVKHRWQYPEIFLGAGNAARSITFATAAPTTGQHGAGDRVFNSAPAVGQPKGWICTVGGTPGTWVSEGNL